MNHEHTSTRSHVARAFGLSIAVGLSIALTSVCRHKLTAALSVASVAVFVHVLLSILSDIHWASQDHSESPAPAWGYGLAVPGAALVLWLVPGACAFFVEPALARKQRLIRWFARGLGWVMMVASRVFFFPTLVAGSLLAFVTLMTMLIASMTAAIFLEEVPGWLAAAFTLLTGEWGIWRGERGWHAVDDAHRACRAR